MECSKAEVPRVDSSSGCLSELCQEQIDMLRCGPCKLQSNNVVMVRLFRAAGRTVRLRLLNDSALLSFVGALRLPKLRGQSCRRPVSRTRSTCRRCCAPRVQRPLHERAPQTRGMSFAWKVELSLGVCKGRHRVAPRVSLLLFLPSSCPSPLGSPGVVCSPGSSGPSEARLRLKTGIPGPCNTFSLKGSGFQVRRGQGRDRFRRALLVCDCEARCSSPVVVTEDQSPKPELQGLPPKLALVCLIEDAVQHSDISVLCEQEAVCCAAVEAWKGRHVISRPRNGMGRCGGRFQWLGLGHVGGSGRGGCLSWALLVERTQERPPQQGRRTGGPGRDRRSSAQQRASRP